MTFDPIRRRRPLNFHEACLRARELWGEAGAVEVRHSAPVDQRYVVGTKGAEAPHTAFGCGASWEEAFANAEKGRAG